MHQIKFICSFALPLQLNSFQVGREQIPAARVTAWMVHRSVIGPDI